MSAEIRGYCWSCGHALTALDLGREQRCPGCDKATHCCRNCRHYARGVANDCREPMVERIVDKDRANFCDWFQPACTVPGAADGARTADADALRRAAEDLFK